MRSAQHAGMDAVRKRTNTWWRAAGLFVACVALVLGSVTGLRLHAAAPATAGFGALVRHAEGDRELLRVTNEQDGSVRLYDAGDGRPLSIATAEIK